jgi:chromosome partitioning protein
MLKVLIANPKGGVGKTTVADELAFALERQGKVVCFLNLDNQGAVIHSLSMPSPDTEVLIIDTPPVFNIEFSRWIEDADIVILPVSASARELPPLLRALDVIGESKKKPLVGIVLNNYNARRKVDSDFLVYLKARDLEVYCKIPTTTAIRKAQLQNTSVYDIDKYGLATSAFNELAERMTAIKKK